MRRLVNFVAGLSLFLPGCVQDEATPTYNLTVNWAVNREAAVNRTGGGYRVYYSTTSGFDIPAGTVADVPFVSGSQAPTSFSVAGVTAGTYYVKVVAYSSLNPPGSSLGSVSAASSETSIKVP